MPIADLPNTPPLHTPVIMARADTAPASIHRSIRVCRALSNMPAANSVTVLNTVTPASDVMNYLQAFENRTVVGPASVTVLALPSHGKLEDVGTVAFDETMHSERDTGLQSYTYLPDAHYLGADHATVQVNIGNVSVKTEYLFQVAAALPAGSSQQLCPQPYARLSPSNGAAAR